MQKAAERFDESCVRGFLHRPSTSSGDALVLTHGAGANCAAPLLVTVAEAFCAAGFWVLRFDLPFRQSRPFGPPHPGSNSEDRAGIHAAINCIRPLSSKRVFAGGHSYGGRQASMLAAEDPRCCDALLLLSYPLHPPNKPQQMRTAHFMNLRVPALFVQGTTDPFGSLDEMRAAVQLIRSPTHISTVPGAGHDLKRGKFDIPALAIEPFVELAG